MAPNNRMTAYQNARAAEKPQKGLTYSELLLDNLIGFDNEYASTGEQLGQAFRDDPLGFLKNAGVSAYEGTKNAVLHPITTAEELLSGLYDSGANVLSTLGPEPAYLDNALQEMYGVSYDAATDEQVSRAREALFGDVLNVASVVPVGRAAKAVGAPVAKAIDKAHVNAANEFFRETGNPSFNPEAAANARFFYPSQDEIISGTNSQDPELGAYADKALEAEELLKGGLSAETVLSVTGIMPVPLRSATGADAGFRLVLPTDEQGIAALRTNSPYTFKTIEDPQLTGLDYGEFRPSRDPGAGPLDYEIAINPGLSPQRKASTYRHERTHADLMEGGVGWNELGMSDTRAFDLQQEALDTLDELISDTTDVTEKTQYGKLRKELSDMTSFEAYSRNPGEMLARLSEGDLTMAKRLSAIQVLNPYLNPRSLPTRAAQALETALRSETRPYMRFLKSRAPFISGFDVHTSVPMDMNKALITDPGYVPENQGFIADPQYWNGLGDPWEGIDDIPPSFPNRDDDIPFAKGGIVKGSYLDNDPYD